jgi:hypothetical protein
MRFTFYTHHVSLFFALPKLFCWIRHWVKVLIPPGFLLHGIDMQHVCSMVLEILRKLDKVDFPIPHKPNNTKIYTV